MLQNWHAFFFNSLDSASFVTIDKPPLGFWLQAASAKLFGYSGVALMLPQALAGVCSVWLLYHLVSRVFGKPAGLLAALALAITPISVVANRNNIVDSTLVVAVLLGAWAVSRAVETGKLRWLLLCALFVGLGFNIKMLQAFLILPAFGLMYLVGAHISWRRRLVNLSLATVMLLAVSLSWVTAVDLTPASQRPWVGSTTNNSALSLAIGYNGLQRLTGNSSVGGGSHAASSAGKSSSSSASGSSGNAGPSGNSGGPGGVGENGPIGLLRLLDAQLGSQIGWLLPLAAIGLLAGIWQTRRRWPRRGTPSWVPSQQSALVLWGTWLLTTDAFFSIAGFYHTYYLVMVAPAIAALSGIGIVSLWQTYRQRGSKLWWLLPVSLLAVAGVQVHLLAAYPAWSRWLSPLILGLAVLSALALAFLRLRPILGRRGMVAALLLGVAALLAAPAVWSAETVIAADSGLTPRSGPVSTTSSGGPAGFTMADRSGSSQSPGGGFAPPGGKTGSTNKSLSSKLTASFQPRSGNRQPSGGGGSGTGDQVNKALLKYLEAHQGTATYLFATTNAGTAEPYIIATGKPVMALGGFTGSDPILTTAQLAKLAREGKVKYFLLSGGGRGGNNSSSLTTWVQQHSKLVTVNGVQLYEYTG
jgi:4-amino-4-deoxy-L-arabinose transferase-like glycosyltransferase